MLRLSRSHDQNRRRAGETAGKAATLAVQRDVLKKGSGSGGGRRRRGGGTADRHRKHGGAGTAQGVEKKKALRGQKGVSISAGLTGVRASARRL